MSNLGARGSTALRLFQPITQGCKFKALQGCPRLPTRPRSPKDTRADLSIRLTPYIPEDSPYNTFFSTQSPHRTVLELLGCESLSCLWTGRGRPDTPIAAKPSSRESRNQGPFLVERKNSYLHRSHALLLLHQQPLTFTSHGHLHSFSIGLDASRAMDIQLSAAVLDVVRRLHGAISIIDFVYQHLCPFVPLDQPEAALQLIYIAHSRDHSPIDARCCVSQTLWFRCATTQYLAT